MAKGLSLHIGVNLISKAGYPMDPPHPDWPDGWDGPLKSAEFDAEDMCQLATSMGFTPTVIKTADATVENVVGAIRHAAGELTAGDMFFLTYAGHGGQLRDTSGDETDSTDETWCLYDRQLLDDELFALYNEFDPGVRIVILSDSCHSGSVSRAGPSDPEKELTEDEKKKLYDTASPRVRAMPNRNGEVTAFYQARREEYDRIQASIPPQTGEPNIIQISACLDNQEALDGDFNGKFTAMLKHTWGPLNDPDNCFKGSYKELHETIRKKIEEEFAEIVGDRSAGDNEGVGPQIPRLFKPGKKEVDWENERPFKI